MVDQPASHLARTGKNVHYARRKAGLKNDLRIFEADKRSDLGSLQNCGVPCRQYRSKLMSLKRNRRVPGCDGRDHAHGFTHRHGPIVSARRRNLGLKSLTSPCIIAERSGGAGYLLAAFLQRLPVVLHLHVSQALGVRGDQFARRGRAGAPAREALDRATLDSPEPRAPR